LKLSMEVSELEELGMGVPSLLISISRQAEQTEVAWGYAVWESPPRAPSVPASPPPHNVCLLHRDHICHTMHGLRYRTKSLLFR
jgi:hypothetical protein